MQSVLMIRAHTGGLVYLNGRMAGEAGREHPLTLPVSPNGTILLELRPFQMGYLPFTVRFSLTSGKPRLPHPDPRVYAACWPDALIELELRPERIPAPAQILFREGGICFSYMDACPPVLRCDTDSASFFHPLPDGALPPVLRPFPSARLLTGTLRSSDQYALILSDDAAHLLCTLVGRNISVLPDNASVRFIRPLGDTAGHAFLETWSNTADGWACTWSEPMWADGMPTRPQTPVDTALAAVEAAQLHLAGEAMSYCSARWGASDIFSLLAEYDGCTRLRVPLSDGSDAVGVTKLEDGILRVLPVRYTASRGGTYGAWQLESLEVDKST